MFEWLRGDRPEKDTGDAVVADSEYAVIELVPSWGLASIAAGLYSLPIRSVARHLPWHPVHYWFTPGKMVLLILAMAALGLFFAGLGLRSGRGRMLSKVGLFLNATVIGVLVLFVGTIWAYFRLF